MNRDVGAVDDELMKKISNIYYLGADEFEAAV